MLLFCLRSLGNYSILILLQCVTIVNKLLVLVVAGVVVVLVLTLTTLGPVRSMKGN